MGVWTRLGLGAVLGAVVLGLSVSAWAQDAPAAPQQPAAQQTPGGTPTAPDAAQAPAQIPAPNATQDAKPDATQTATPAADAGQTGGQQPAGGRVDTRAGGITEEELKKLLVGKPLYLRDGYLDNSLSFNEHGGLIGHSPQGSYTLSAIEIDKVRLTKHKVELEGARYGLHFLGALPSEDPTKALDRVKITPKKKVVRVTIDRELVVVPKKKKQGKGGGEKGKSGTAGKAPAAAQNAPANDQTATLSAPVGDQAAGQSAPEEKEVSDADQKKAEIAAAPEAERPADPASVTTTTSPAHATAMLRDALDKIFAPGLDERMMAAMPDFWKLYYQAVAAKADYKPVDLAVLRQNTVDTKAKLVTKFEPESNEWAQASGVAGMALYHTVIGPDGKPGEIAVARPIGFGLDENAVAAIRKATFEPAMKDGKTVPVLLDLVVQFRIYSKRTSVSGEAEADDKTGKQLPGPYSVGEK
jgi:TonB family protein